MDNLGLVQNVLVALSMAAFVGWLGDRARRRRAAELARQRELSTRPPAERRILEHARTALTADILNELRDPRAPRDRERAVGLALAAFEQRAVTAEPAMIQLLSWDDDQVRRAAILALGAIGGRDAITALVEFEGRRALPTDVGASARASLIAIRARLGIGDEGALTLAEGAAGGHLALDTRGTIAKPDEE